MITLTIYQELNDALENFAKHYPTFPVDFVAIEFDSEPRKTQSGNYWLKYRCESGDEIANSINLPISWEDFEVQIAELWDEIDFRENPVEESLVCVE